MLNIFTKRRGCNRIEITINRNFCLHFQNPHGKNLHRLTNISDIHNLNVQQDLPGADIYTHSGTKACLQYFRGVCSQTLVTFSGIYLTPFETRLSTQGCLELFCPYATDAIMCSLERRPQQRLCCNGYRRKGKKTRLIYTLSDLPMA